MSPPISLSRLERPPMNPSANLFDLTGKVAIVTGGMMK